MRTSRSFASSIDVWTCPAIYSRRWALPPRHPIFGSTIHEPPPLAVEIAYRDPWDAARRLAGSERAPGLVFLDSAMVHPTLGRWSYVMAEPFGRFRVEGSRAFWNDAVEQAPPLEALRARLARYRAGAVGR